jgi:hypothetical protein
MNVSLSGVPDDFQLCGSIYPFEDRFNTPHHRVIQQVVTAILTLEDWQPLQNDNG